MYIFQNLTVRTIKLEIILLLNYMGINVNEDSHVDTHGDIRQHRLPMFQHWNKHFGQILTFFCLCSALGFCIELKTLFAYEDSNVAKVWTAQQYP